MGEIRKDNAQQEKPTEGKSTEVVEQAAEEVKPSAEEAEITAEQEIVKMQQELEEANDMMLRLAAELDNYKKRVAKERESLFKYATQDIIQELLPILDNFERAIESANKSKDCDSLLGGVRMIFKQMYDALERRGVSRINAVGEPFDPTIHEAVMQVASEKHPENVVVQELQRGYMLHDRVIRPSMVAVSKRADVEAGEQGKEE